MPTKDLKLPKRSRLLFKSPIPRGLGGLEGNLSGGWIPTHGAALNCIAATIMNPVPMTNVTDLDTEACAPRQMHGQHLEPILMT